MWGLAWEHSIGSRKASVRAKVEHSFLIVKRQFGCARCCYRGQAKNASAVTVLFGLANVAMWIPAGSAQRRRGYRQLGAPAVGEKSTAGAGWADAAAFNQRSLGMLLHRSFYWLRCFSGRFVWI